MIIPLFRGKLTISLISQALKKSDQTTQGSLIGYLLLLQATFICNEYEECWSRLHDIINHTGFYKAQSKTRDIPIALFQIYFLGCNVALRLNKIQLAEQFGLQ